MLTQNIYVLLGNTHSSPQCLKSEYFIPLHHTSNYQKILDSYFVDIQLILLNPLLSPKFKWNGNKINSDFMLLFRDVGNIQTVGAHAFKVTLTCKKGGNL